MKSKCGLVAFILLFYVSIVISKDTNITIPLDILDMKTAPKLFSGFVNLERISSVIVNFEKVNSGISFIVFQVHSYLYKVRAYKNKDSKVFVEGTNTGIYMETSAMDSIVILNMNTDVDLKIFIVVQGYQTKGPIPGGCNMEFPGFPIAPYMRTTIMNGFIEVDAPIAAIDNRDPYCYNTSQVVVFFYMMYMPDRSQDIDTYFDTIEKMVTFKGITTHGVLVYQTRLKVYMRRYISAYPGTGAVYVAIAYDLVTGVETMYTPTHSYGCSLLAHDCDLIEDYLSRLFCASLLFVGLFVCYFGHKFFKTQMLVLGAITGMLFSYIVLPMIAYIDGPDLLLVAIFLGGITGIVRVMCWWYFGLPVFAIVSSALNVGFLFASLMYYIKPDGPNWLFLHEDFDFWPLFVLIVLLVLMFLLSVNFIANILCCAVVGSYATVFAIDFYLGSNMKYILINTVRRATLKDYEYATMMPPCMWQDITLILLWIILASSGVCYQYYLNIGKPPFPPPPQSIRRRSEHPALVHRTNRRATQTINASDATHSRTVYDERTPLLA